MLPDPGDLCDSDALPIVLFLLIVVPLIIAALLGVDFSGGY
jgi:hypothetical protein